MASAESLSARLEERAESLPDLARVFESSLGRCVASHGFIRSFYRRFLASSPEVARRFENTDFATQEQVLTLSLSAMAKAALQEPEGVDRLESLAESHSRRRLDITPGLYEFWLDALLSTVEEHDEQFSAEVRRAWASLLGACISRMIAVYRSSQTVPPGHPETDL